MSSPRFSIIVPMYNVQGYLAECLDSILDQDFADFEIIGVDDRSPDASGEILDEYAARDPRVRSLRLEQNLGLGLARNEGLKIARGDYVFFLDSDDYITAGSLGQIAKRLDETDDPDVLIFDYARTYWWGKVARNSLARTFRSGVPDVFTIAEQPKFLDFIMVVWNKVYRREFVEEHGFAFPPGYYEDTPWTFPVMFKAERVTTLDRIVVHYRQRRQGNILGTVSRKHFDIFAQYERVFAVIEEDARLHRWKSWLFGSMMWHLLSILHKQRRVPADSRAEYFAECHRMFTTYCPDDFVAPGGVTGLKYRLIRTNHYWVFQVLKIAAERLRKVKSLVRRGKNVLKSAYQAANYWIGRKLPMRNDLALYSSYWHRGYSCNPMAIYESAREIAPEVKGVWAVRESRQDTVPEGVRTITPGTGRYWRTLARAKYLVNNANFEDRLVKRAGSVHVQTHHGTPLKHMGLGMRDYPTAAKGMDFNALLARCDRWDWSLSSNRHSSLVWERAYPASYTCLESGYPRNDRLVNASVEEIKRIRAELGISDGTRVILYAPTHRDYNYSYVPAIDFAQLADQLGEGYVLLVRTHYFYAADRDHLHPRVIDVTNHLSTEDLELAADILLTDYSSIVFDYANLDRPVVVYADDWETYRNLRGVYFDFMEHRPGHVAHTQSELVDLLRTGRFDDVESRELRQAFRERFCDFDDGHAAERVVRTVMGGEDRHSVPLIPLDERLSDDRRAWDVRLSESVVQRTS